MRRDILDSRWLQYALLILLLAGGMTGGLILLGCDGQDAQGTQVIDPDQRNPEGGVYFASNDSRTEAKVIVSPTINGQEVKWYVPKYQPYAVIRDPQNDNQVTILRPPNDVSKSAAVIEGDYTRNNGDNVHVQRYILITNNPKL